MFGTKRRAADREARARYLADVEAYGVPAADAMAAQRHAAQLEAATARLMVDTAAALDLGRAAYSTLERPAAGWGVGR